MFCMFASGQEEGSSLLGPLHSRGIASFEEAGHQHVRAALSLGRGAVKLGTRDNDKQHIKLTRFARQI